jgi:N-acetylglucosamine-6-phosphate deacetylase
MSAEKSDGEISGRHYATRQLIRIRWRDGIITEIEPLKEKSIGSEPERDTQEVWLAPCLFELQINGYGGVDFQQENLTLDDLVTATRSLRAAGCAYFFVTLITDEWSALTGRLRHFRCLCSQSPELEAAIAGWHIEGPFLSSEPGFHGAHNPDLLCDPSPEHILELRSITGNDPVLLTLSPERPRALEAIALAVSKGMKVSLGHTNASADILQQAVAAGATGFTHLGNGCPRELDRHDNILWRVFDMSGLTASLIPDQIHVSPSLFRLAHWVLGADSVYYTTDAMAAAGMPPGRYPLGKWQLEVGADQIVRQPGKSLFAGSALRPIDGIFRAAEMLGCPWQQVWPRFSEAPARFMGLRNELEVGQSANICVLKVINRRRPGLQVVSNGAFSINQDALAQESPGKAGS